VALVELLLRRAVERRASDVHVEPAGGGLRVRIRVDGVLQELVELPAHACAPVTSRLKVMGGLDISVKRRPQDGRAALRVAGRDLALRVSTLPAQGGEKVVLRILDPEQAGLPLERLGMAAEPLARMRAMLARSHGVMLVTGPTGSGKTTTLYACLGELDRERRNVVTLEDPVEYRLPGLTQVQVHSRAGLSFGAALRAVLRQDPDVIMVGELRDRETVEIALTAALTGHLVLATLHTNDAATAAARLLEMKAPPYLVAGGLVGVVAQRLARRLCGNCRLERSAGRAELARLGLPLAVERLYDPRGCPRCGGSGFRGRIGVFEVLAVEARMRELILRKAPADTLREAAHAGGMVPLSHDAWRHVRMGATTMEEVAPLLALLSDEAPLCRRCGTALRRGWGWCPACGGGVRRACRCGEWLEDGWRRCPGCGRPAGGAARVQQEDA
jgi:type II secretory ATPase GspE/PulE/Tfp pilus assembly ATPase PilB-like protein